MSDHYHYCLLHCGEGSFYSHIKLPQNGVETYASASLTLKLNWHEEAYMYLIQDEGSISNYCTHSCDT